MNKRTLTYLFCLLLATFVFSCKSAKKTTQVHKPTRPVAEVQKEKLPKETKEIPKVTQEIPKVIKDTVVNAEPVGSEVITEDPDDKKNIPEAMREFRAAWIATVANINWPSKSGLSTAQQQEEAIKILDFLQEHHYNAVIFQARPQADAFYKSDLEPWSYFLTGTQGKAPDPFYDPLEFWIEQSHLRGMELHVWLNPYRAHHTTGGAITETSVVKKHPELSIGLKNGMWWLDPANPATQEYSAAVVMDIVKRYDIDGIHFDDYFYPYASYNKNQDFPDAISFSTYQKSKGKLSRGDWRRENVNKFIERVYHDIKKEKPEVKFGVSPFGIYRPGSPEGITGMDQYNELFADAKLWLNEGWIDYFTPQLYWKINKKNQSFPVLLGWWKKENTKKRHLWPGINIDFGGDEENIDETINEIMISRGMLPESMGTVHWSVGPLLKYPALTKALLDGPYQKEALVPASPWLDKSLPASPKVKTEISGNTVEISWENMAKEEVFRWVVYFNYNGKWDYKILNEGSLSTHLQNYLNEREKKNPLAKIAVTAIDRTGNESDFISINISR